MIPGVPVRFLLVVALLAGCSDDPKPVVVDTDPHDPGDSDDTDPGDTDVGPTVCLEPLDGGQMPSSWAALTTHGERFCVRTWRCPDGASAAVGAWWSECEGSRQSWFGTSGAKLAELMNDDTQTCADDVHSVWYGRVVDDCPMSWETATSSVACALPRELAPGDGCLDDAAPFSPIGATTWTEAEAVLATSCLAVATCTSDDRTLHLVYVQDVQCGESGRLGVWDDATGALVASASAAGGASCSGASGLTWSGEALDGCLPATFTPTAACGVVALP